MPTRRTTILLTLLLCAFAVNVDVTIVNVTLPTLVRELHASTGQLQWVVDAYTLAFASLVLAAGTLSDRYGRRGVLLAGLVVYAVANALAGIVDSAGALIALRAVMGVGAALIFPSTLSIITNVFTEPAARAKAIGAWGAVTGAAVALGPIVGGAAIDASSWHAAFLIKVPVALVALIAVVRVVPSSKDPAARRLDLPGVALTTAGVASIVYAIIEAPSNGWGAPGTFALLAVGALLLLIWAAWQRRAAAPMFDVTLLRNPRFTAAAGAVTVAFFALAGFTFLITQFFQFLRGYSPLEAGVRLLPVAISVGAASVIGTQLAVRLRPRAIVAAGLASLAIAYLWISTGDVSTSYLTIVGQMLFLGAGMGLTSAPATQSLMGAASNDTAGVAAAVNDTTRELGNTLGVAVIGSIFASVYRHAIATGDLAGITGRAAAAVHQSVGAALIAAHQVRAAGLPVLAEHVRSIAARGFVSGLSTGCVVAGGVCIAGALVVLVALRGEGSPQPTATTPAQPTTTPASRAPRTRTAEA